MAYRTAQTITGRAQAFVPEQQWLVLAWATSTLPVPMIPVTHRPSFAQAFAAAQAFMARPVSLPYDNVRVWGPATGQQCQWRRRRPRRAATGTIASYQWDLVSCSPELLRAGSRVLTTGFGNGHPMTPSSPAPTPKLTLAPSTRLYATPALVTLPITAPPAQAPPPPLPTPPMEPAPTAPVPLQPPLPVVPPTPLPGVAPPTLAPGFEAWPLPPVIVPAGGEAKPLAPEPTKAGVVVAVGLALFAAGVAAYYVLEGSKLRPNAPETAADRRAAAAEELTRLEKAGKVGTTEYKRAQAAYQEAEREDALARARARKKRTRANARRKLKTETDTKAMERRVRRAARDGLGLSALHTEAFFEHGQWWVRERDTGRTWSVVDEFPGIDGFGFEEV